MTHHRRQRSSPQPAAATTTMPSPRSTTMTGTGTGTMTPNRFTPSPPRSPRSARSPRSPRSPKPNPNPKFTLFPLLPPELRLEIYRHACPPRVTILRYLPAPHDTFVSPTHPPTLLHVSRESRAEGTRRLYVRCFLPASSREGEGVVEEGEGGEGGRYFYHHPVLDTLYFPRPCDAFGLGYAGWARDFASRLPGVAAVARRLAVDYVPGEVRRPWEVFGKVCLMRGCARLEEAFLVVGFQDQQTAAAAAAGRDGEGNGEGAEVEFVDPRADDGEIMGIMERVRESFRVELGDGVGLGKAVEEGEEGGARDEMGLVLVPKAKVMCPWGGHRSVACA